YKEAQTHYGKALGLNPSSSTFTAGFKAASVLAFVFDSQKNTEKSKAVAVLPPAISPSTQGKKYERKEGIQRENFQLQFSPPSTASKIMEEYETKTYEFVSVKEISTASQTNMSKELSNSLALPSSPSFPKENIQTQSSPLPKYSKTKNETSSENFQKISGPDIESSFKMTIGYELQVASHRSIKQANSLASSLQNSGFPAAVKSWTDKRGYEWYRTILGPFITRDEALSQKENLRERRKGEIPLVRFAAVKIDSSNKRTQEQTFSARDQILLKTVGIEISNGNGVNGMARMIGTYLNQEGIKVVRLTNASNFNHRETTIYYEKGYHESANYLAGCFPTCNNLKEREKLDRPQVKVKILIGKDLIERDKLQKSKQAS
ncbi:MAG TPA: LytR C-terminal domain-containing protein, partial [Thermodesulfobacteriota bacterium]|nr:LytR C-terminal domain-containing protein [Thermodesulfobacteriota bacterium]